MTDKKVSNKLLILILAALIAINITVTFTYHIFEENWLITQTPAHEIFAHRVIMTYHSVSTPFIGIVLLLFLEFLEIRKKVVVPIKIMAIVGGINCGIGAIFWAYTDLFILHHFFVGGLGLLFICALTLCYGLIPEKEVKENDYYHEIPDIRGFNLIHLNAMIIILGMIVFTIFGALAALIMLTENPPVHFFLIEEITLDAGSPIYEKLANYHGRLTTSFFLTGILILVFKYTKVKGKAAKLGLWILLPGTLGMALGYFLMIILGPWAEIILMPSRVLILSTGAIIAIDAWIKIEKEELGSEYERSSFVQKFKAAFQNPLRLAMYLPFVIAILVVVIPSLIIVADLETYGAISYIVVMRNFATGHPHTLVTLAAIVIFSLIVHDMLPKNAWRKVMGWIMITSQIITFPIAAIYFIRDPTSTAMATAFKHIIISGLFLLLANIIIFIVLASMQVVTNRDWISLKFKGLVEIK